MLTHRSFTLAEKREAVDKILASATFARSEQLRHFLQYVREMEMAGRGGEINEYIIGVDVLHRPDGYAPGTDSSVRSRAYELRQRLERYYEKESPDSPIRIELPKGSYAPVFVEASALCPPVAPSTPAEVVAPSVPAVRHWPVAGAFLAGALLMLTAAVLWNTLHTSAGVDPIVREAWGPLAHPGANALIMIGSTLHMNVRPNWMDTPDGPPRYKALPEMYSYYRKQRPLKPGVELFLHPTENTLDFGELKAVVIATNNLRSFGATYQLLPERATSIAALRGRNTILLGNSQTSSIAHEELLRGMWTIDFEPPLGRVAIVDQKAAGRPTPFLGEYGKPGEPTWCCGLITVMPTEGAANDSRTVIVSGITPTGSDAAMDYFTSAAALRDLRRRFQSEGYTGFPSAYQVVVKCRSKDTFLLASEYAAHHVLAR